MLLNGIFNHCKAPLQQISNFNLKQAIDSIGSKIEYLWLKTFCRPSFTTDELDNIEDFGKLLNKKIEDLTSDNVSTFFNNLLANPKGYNKIFSRGFRLHSARKKAGGKTSDAFERGLISLKDLTFSLYQLNSHSNLDSLKKRVNKISHLNDLELADLKESEKLSSHEVYLTQIASRIGNTYKNIVKYLDIDDVDTTQEFLRNSATINKKIWKNVSLEEQTLLFIGEEKYLSATKKKRPHFLKLRKMIRRGDQQHVSLLTNEDGKKRPTQVHITYKRYENGPLRVLDILSSEFITLNLKDLLTKKGRQIIEDQGDDIDLYLKDLWKEKLNELISNKDLLKIRNSNIRKVLAATKWLGLKQKNKELDGSNIICSEFIIILIATLLNEIDKELKNDHESDDRFLLNPFEDVQACNYTPGDVYRLIQKYGQKRSVSDYLKKILT